MREEARYGAIAGAVAIALFGVGSLVIGERPGFDATGGGPKVGRHPGVVRRALRSA